MSQKKSGFKRTKETDQLFQQVNMEVIASTENMTLALKQVVSNKGSPGIDRKPVEEVKKHASEILRQLQKELLTGKYRPGNIKRVWIPKPGGGQRGLGIPNVVDRWVQ